MATVRPAAVAGIFYPGDPKQLDASVQFYLAEATATIENSRGPVPKAIIVPHAGYIYSGLTAAAAFARLGPIRDKIKRVVMMGPCHRVAVNGLALSGADEFATPLGSIPIDKEAVRRAVELPGVEIFDDTHKQDHSLEVHLPFLQVLLDEFSIVPFIVGQASVEQVARVLEDLWGGEETLILISSDLSHYLNYDAARSMDDQTRQAIEGLDISALGDKQACGRYAVKGLMQVARERGLSPSTVDVRNSGDTAGDKDRVVGYGSWVFVPSRDAQPKPRTPRQSDDPTALPVEDFAEATRQMMTNFGANMLQVAAASICYTLQSGKQLMANIETFPPELRENGASFVTLDLDKKLRGCVGTLQSARPLIADIADNAHRAAFKDRRFSPLTKEELMGAERDLSISVLSPQVPMTFKDEADLLGQLRPKLDGLVIQDQGKRAVFLPIVWDSLGEPAPFIRHLKRKAGLTEDHWSDTFRAWRFTTEVVHSQQISDPESLWRGLE